MKRSSPNAVNQVSMPSFSGPGGTEGGFQKPQEGLGNE